MGAAAVEESDELLVVMERGRVVRSRVAEVPSKGRTTMGVVFAKPDKGDRILLVTTSPESEIDEERGGGARARGYRGVGAQRDVARGMLWRSRATGSRSRTGHRDDLGSDESDQSPAGDDDPNEE